VQPNGNTTVSSQPSFWLYYQFDPKGNHYCSKINATTWVERFPDNSTSTFNIVQSTVLDGVAGTIVQKRDEVFQLFIPDRDAANRWIRFRHSTGGGWSWLAELTYY
jgi:hypothetical protein